MTADNGYSMQILLKQTRFYFYFYLYLYLNFYFSVVGFINYCRQRILRSAQTLVFVLHFPRKINLFFVVQERNRKFKNVNYSSACVLTAKVQFCKIETKNLQAKIDEFEKSANLKQAKIKELKDIIEDKTKTIIDNTTTIKVMFLLN